MIAFASGVVVRKETIVVFQSKPSKETSESYGDEQAFGKWPFTVHPLRNTLEACSPAHFCGFVPPILMTTFSPDCLIASKRELGFVNGDGLGFNGAEMHLDSALAGIVEGNMLEIWISRNLLQVHG